MEYIVIELIHLVTHDLRLREMSRQSDESCVSSVMYTKHKGDAYSTGVKF